MITEDLGLFLADFGVACVFGARTVTVLLDMPDTTVLGGLAQSTSYSMTYRTSDLPGLAHDSAVTVNGVSYNVITVSLIDDGVFSTAALEKT